MPALPSGPVQVDGRGETDALGESLVQAAQRLLAEQGAGALTVRRIAAAANTTTMTVYSRFGGKDALVDRLFVEGFRRLGEALAAAGETDDPMHDLFEAGLAYRRFASANATYYHVMFDRAVPDYMPSFDARERALETLMLLARQCRRGMEAGLMRRADPLATATSLWATVHGLVGLETRGLQPPGVEWSNIYPVTIKALLDGLRT